MPVEAPVTRTVGRVALNNQGFVGTNMVEAMGFELMDLLQSTVFKTFNNSTNFNEL